MFMFGILGLALLFLGLIWGDELAKGLEYLVPGIGLSLLLWSLYSIVNEPPAPPKPPKTVQQIIKEEYDSCVNNLSADESVKSTRKTKQQICAESMETVRAMLEGKKIASPTDLEGIGE